MNGSIEWLFRMKNGTEVKCSSEPLSAAQAILFADDLEKTGRAKQITFIDSFDSSWTLKELRNYTKKIETEPHQISIFFDGGFDWQTKTAGLGCVIYYEQNGKSYRLRKNQRMTGLISNNEAEYAALYFCLQQLIDMHAHGQLIEIAGDSRVVIQHLNEQWPVIEETLYSWADKIEALLAKHRLQAGYELISRKANKEADRLAAQAMDGVDISAVMEK